MAFFVDIVTVEQYLMGVVIPAQRQLGADIIVAGGGESGFLPRYLERPGRRKGCDGKRGILIVRGERGGLLTVWKKK